MKDDKKKDVAEPVKVEPVSTEQASLALANMLSRGVKMVDAKKRLGIK